MTSRFRSGSPGRDKTCRLRGRLDTRRMTPPLPLRSRMVGGRWVALDCGATARVRAARRGTVKRRFFGCIVAIRPSRGLGGMAEAAGRRPQGCVWRGKPPATTHCGGTMATRGKNLSSQTWREMKGLPTELNRMAGAGSTSTSDVLADGGSPSPCTRGSAGHASALTAARVATRGLGAASQQCCSCTQSKNEVGS